MQAGRSGQASTDGRRQAFCRGGKKKHRRAKRQAGTYADKKGRHAVRTREQACVGKGKS